MFTKIGKTVCAFLAFALVIQAGPVFAMGSKPDTSSSASLSLENAPTSNVTLKDLAKVYWPDSDATTVQQEDTLKKLLGKAVTWEITVAEIQRDGSGYLVQGRSDENMIGTFSYISPTSENEIKKIQSAAQGRKHPKIFCSYPVIAH